MINLSRQPLGDSSFEFELHNFLKSTVPNTLITDGSWTVGAYRDGEVLKQVLDQISWWLLEGDQAEVLSELEKLNNPSNICGHVFKVGEATYTCRECAVDPTCVLCQKCFRQSVHINHKYKLHSSGGGGCCDCGDLEAWKSFPSCDFHTVDSSASVVDAKLKLPASFRIRAEKFFRILLEYAVDSLTTDRTESNQLPENLCLGEAADKYVTMVFNDESHTFNHVINVLRRAASCNANTASDFATIIDREGRTAILIGTRLECKAAQEVVMNGPPQSILLHRRSGPLKTRVMHASVVAHQEFSVALLAWMNKIAEQSEGLRHIISHTLLTTIADDPNSQTLATRLMLADTTLWKVARGAYEQVLMSTVLLQNESKRLFAVQYTRVYKTLMTDFLADDHDHSDSITSISVQLFTVPTMARYLVVEEDLLQVILGTIISSSCIKLEDQPGQLNFKFDSRKLKKNFRRLQFCFYDLKYALTNVPTNWDEDLKNEFKGFFKMFVVLLASLEGMDSVVRKTDHHLIHEPEWETGVTLHMRLIPIIRRIYDWCSACEDIVFCCLEVTVSQMQKLFSREKKEIVVYNSANYECINYDITTKPVSVHYPLTRLAAGLLVQFGKLDLSLTTCSIVTNHIIDITEFSFRTLSLCAQVIAGAWRRNGMSLANQAYYFRDHQCRAEAFNRDIHMLQACAAIMDPNHFFVTLYHKLNLMETEKFGEYLTSLYEELISIIIYVCVERYTEGIGLVTFEEQVQREVIHILASGPKPHSKIQKRLSYEISDKPGWERILRDVADYKPPTNIRSVARYELKVDYLQEISPCFYHYSTASEQTNAQNEIIRRKKANSQSCVFTPRPSPPFTRPFAKTIDVLQCSALIFFLREILQKFLADAPIPLDWSDKLFEKILYLIGFGIVEERQRVKEDQQSAFKFCEKAEQGGLLEVLRSLSTKASITIHHENICWILNAVDDVVKRRLGLVDEVDSQPTVVKIDAKEKDKRKKLAEERRANLMQQMKLMQKKFLEQNTMVVEEDEKESEVVEAEVSKSKTDFPVCTSLSRQLSSVETNEEPSLCILCQDDSQSRDCLVMAAFVQRSSVLYKGKRGDMGETMVGVVGDLINRLGIHMSTCSHVMHFDCWNQYYASVKEREVRRHRMSRTLSYSTVKNEFLCPLCSRLSNCIIPLISHSSVVKQRNLCPTTPDGMTVQEWMRLMNDFVDPPAPIKQEVVVKLHVDMSPESEEWHDAAETLPDDVIQSTPEDMQTSQEWVDVEDDSIESAFNTLAASIKSVISDTEQSEDNENGDSSIMVCQAAATTLQVAAYVSQYQETPLMAPSSIRVTQALSNVIRCCFMSIKYKEGSFQKEHEEHIKILLGKSSVPLLCNNMFNMFTRFIFSCESLRESVNCSSINNDRNVLLLCALAQIVQIMIYIDMDEITGVSTSDSPLVQLFNQVRSYAGMPSCDAVNEEKLENCISTSFDPFIRSCALFMRHMTNIAPPVTLEQEDNREEILRYLGLPSSILAYFDASGTTSLEPLVQRWCSIPVVVETFTIPLAKCLTYPNLARVNTLIKLDEDYSDIIAKASDFVCPRFGGDDDSVSPTMCLICGVLLCSQSYCCQRSLNGTNVGACSYHASICSYGCGIFLRGRDCTVILLNESRGSFRPAPYLDEYGETDQGLRRGNPMMLDKYRLKELNLLWLNHAVPESIVREMESNRIAFHLDWNHL